MDTNTIRETFLSFFEDKGHTRMASASLIPQDPTVLLNIAGMLPFVPYFNGDAAPPALRLVSAQKCVRTNDIENVGRTARHLSFFEMLGNFSFGDYFKREAIRWAWELSTDKYGLDPERIWATAHLDDDDAVALILAETGIPIERIQRFDKDNFWWTGQAGPAGHCAEFFYDKGPEYGVDGGPAADDERFVEYYNCVFTEFVCDDNGKIVGNLPAKNVDTGLGLERLATIMQDVATLYETDLFVPLLAKASALTGVAIGASPATDVSLKVMAEHARSTAFLIADGVLPSKEGRGYVLRSLLRRLVRHARLLGTTQAVVPALIDAVIDVMGGAYPELVAQRVLVTRVASAEESDFARVVDQGLARAEAVIARSQGTFAGDVAFELHDTFGFPVDLTAEIAQDAGLTLDRDRFNELMEQQRARARAASKRGGDGIDADVYREAAAQVGPTEFLGYRSLTGEAELGALVTPGGLITSASEGDAFELIMARSPFYAEGGGQVGDHGVIETPTGRLRVIDTQNALEGVQSHRVVVEAGEVTTGQLANASVDEVRRTAVGRSHSATHILHATMKEVLGSHAQQAGSLNEPGRLRFDFPHFAQVTPEQVAEIERTINDRVLHNPHVTTELMGIDEAKAAGAVANFGDKYGQEVRVVTIGDFSKELCGGTHVPTGATIGNIYLVREESIGSNTRRIEALTGVDAYRYARREMLVAEEVARLLGSSTDVAIERVSSLMDRLKLVEKDLEKLRGQALSSTAKTLADAAERLDGLAVVAVIVDVVNPNELRQVALEVRGHLGQRAVVVLGAATDDGKAQLVCALTQDLVDAGVEARPILHPAAQLVGGGAGGKGDLIQAGGKRGEKLPEALALAAKLAREAVPT
ncbi:MAG: alanyl-tRNA synthetase [Nitriliruptoraceae bacterium]